MNMKYITSLVLFFTGIFVTQDSTGYNELGYTPIPIVLAKAVTIDVKQLSCLATNIYHEANGEPINGQAAVARVVLNRVRHGFARTPCEVVYQVIRVDKTDAETGESRQVKICQFSWVCEGKKTPSKNNPGYRQAETIARDILVNNAYHDVVPKNTLFFHNRQVNPSWSYRHVTTIGNHLFYSKEKRVRPS